MNTNQPGTLIAAADKGATYSKHIELDGTTSWKGSICNQIIVMSFWYAPAFTYTLNVYKVFYIYAYHL